MGLKEELEAIRASGKVKASSATYSATTTCCSPAAEAERRKQKALQEKQSRLDAEKAMHTGASGNINMSLLYKKLMDDQRRKRLEAEETLHKWRKKGDGVGSGLSTSGHLHSSDPGELPPYLYPQRLGLTACSDAHDLPT